MKKNNLEPSLDGAEGITGRGLDQLLVWVDPEGLNVVDSVIHESVHVWQYVCEIADEDEPGAEHEAYTIAHIASTLLKEIKCRI